MTNMHCAQRAESKKIIEGVETKSFGATDLPTYFSVNSRR